MSTSLMGSRGPSGNKIPKGYKTGMLQQFTPEQTSLFQSLFPYVSPGSKLGQLAGGSEEGFAPFEESAHRDFQEFTGQLGSRFAELAPGAMSAKRGSGFKLAAGQGAQDFALALATKRQDLQRQALMDLMGISHSLLGQRPYEQFLVQKQRRPNRLGQMLGIGLPVAGAVGGGLFGGPAGAALGGQLGSSLASGFGGGQQQQSQWQPLRV